MFQPFVLAHGRGIDQLEVVALLHQSVPTTPMRVAVFAIKAYPVFLDPDVKAKAPEDVARAMIDAIRMFDRGPAA